MKNKTRALIANQLINEFSKKFYDEIGVIPIVNYSLDVFDFHKIIDLKEIENIVNTEFKTRYPEAYPSIGIRSKSRKSLTTLHRQIFFKIAREMGYSFTSIASYLDYNHATVLHANRNISNLLDTKDMQVCRTYHLIQHEIKNKYGFNGAIQQQFKEGCDPESVIRDVLSEGERSSDTH